MIAGGKAKRAGLLATQSIRGGANRNVLEAIKGTGDIFFAVSDQNWTLDGASVHVSIIGFDDGTESNRILDHEQVSSISASLTATFDIRTARPLSEMKGIHIEGVKKGAKFELHDLEAMPFLHSPNPHGRPNSDIVRPYINGEDLYEGCLPNWIIYFSPRSNDAEASLYEEPFRHVMEHVYPKYGMKRKKWWVHERPRPEMGEMLSGLKRYLATVKHAKYRVFVWVPVIQLVSNAIELIAKEDDYFFGVLHSRPHEIWGLKQGTRLETRPRYTPTTCFETFPFPDASPDQESAIGAAAAELDRLRSNWLNPPEWTKEEILEFPGSVDGPWARYVVELNAQGIGTVRYPRTIPRDAEAAKVLQKRTLTNLYNERPTWLDLAHKRLDEAVFTAYGWPVDMTDDDLLAALLELNLSRAPA